MTTKEIEKQMDSIIEHLDRADTGKYPTGNLIISITKLLDINRGLITRLEQLEKGQQPPQEWIRLEDRGGIDR